MPYPTRPPRPDAALRAYVLATLLAYPASVWSYDGLVPFGIPWVEWLYVLGLSLWGATAAVLHRLSTGRPRKRILVARDLVSSTLASVLVFLACDYWKVPKALAAIAFTLAGYGGVRFLETAYASVAARLGRAFDAFMKG
jgi:hypothetical protein